MFELHVNEYERDLEIGRLYREKAITAENRLEELKKENEILKEENLILTKENNNLKGIIKNMVSK